MAPLVVGVVGLGAVQNSDKVVQAFYAEAAKRDDTKSFRMYTTELDMWARLGCSLWIRAETRSYQLGVGSIPVDGEVKWIEVPKQFDAADAAKLVDVARRVWCHGDSIEKIASMYSKSMNREPTAERTPRTHSF